MKETEQTVPKAQTDREPEPGRSISQPSQPLQSSGSQTQAAPTPDYTMSDQDAAFIGMPIGGWR